MAEGGTESHPKRFRGDYGQSDEERQRLEQHPPDEVDSGDDHRSPQQLLIYLPPSTTHQPLRFPDKGVDESYLVLEEDATVKSKPCGATVTRQPSGTDTTTDDSSSDVDVTMGSRPKPPRRQSSKRSRTPDNDRGNDETGSEASVVVKSSAALMDVQSPINSQMRCTGRVRHSCFCSGVSRWLRRRHHDPIVLRIIGTQRLPKCGIKVSNFLLHCRGLDEDFEQHYATLTATIFFLPNSCICQQLLNFYNCTLKFTVDVLEGNVEHGRKLGTASAERQLTCGEHNCHSMPITVYRVVDLDRIVYSDTCPDEIFFQITVNLHATSMFSLCESGIDDFLEVSMSSM